MFTEKMLLNRLRQRLRGKGVIPLSTVLSNAIIMRAGQKGGHVKLNINF